MSASPRSACTAALAPRLVLWRRPDKREALPNQIGILVPSRVFCLQQLSDSFPAHYRLATRHDVKLNIKSLGEVMPSWEIAHLADGWAEGLGYGGKTGYVSAAHTITACPIAPSGPVADTHAHFIHACPIGGPAGDPGRAISPNLVTLMHITVAGLSNNMLSASSQLLSGSYQT